MKKILIAAIIILGLSVAVWFVVYKPDARPADTISNEAPFGSGEGVNIPALGSETVGETTPLDEETISTETNVFRISNTPTAGFGVFVRGGNTVVRYVDRGTGHIFEVTMPKAGQDGKIEPIRVTNNTLPKIYEAHFRTDGGAVVIRSLEGEVVKNTTLVLTPPKATSTEALHTIAATSLRGGLDSLLPGTGNILYYVVKDTNTITSSNFTGGESRTLFSSNINNWKLGKLGTNLLVTTKASSQADGYSYSLGASGGALSRVLGPFRGLTAIANGSGNRILYSYTEEGVTKLSVKNNQSNLSSEILPATLSEKCVWSSKEANTFYCGTPLNDIPLNEPDNWYLGRTHFTDYIWKYNILSEISELVAQPKADFDIDLDVYQPRVGTNEDYLFFLNKRDMTFWAVRL